MAHSEFEWRLDPPFKPDPGACLSRVSVFKTGLVMLSRLTLNSDPLALAASTPHPVPSDPLLMRLLHLEHLKFLPRIVPES